jgi:hypothetical protein
LQLQLAFGNHCFQTREILKVFFFLSFSI